MAKPAQKTAPEIGIGHNSEVATPKQVSDSLNMRFADLLGSTSAALESARALPEKITDKDSLGATATVVSNIRVLFKTAESHREKEKAPYLVASRAVDGFFKEEIIGKLVKAADILGRRVNDYQQVLLAAEREARRKEEQRRADEERVAREAAAEAERRASRARTEASRAAADAAAEAAQAAAVQAARRADEAAEATQVNAAGMARQRFDNGPMVTMRTIKYAKVVNIEEIPLNLLRPYLKPEAIEAAVKAWGKLTSYSGTMPGVEVGEIEESVVI